MLYLFMLVYTFVVHGRKYVPEHKHAWGKWKKHSIRTREKHNPNGADFHLVERVDIRCCAICQAESRNVTELFKAQGYAGQCAGKDVLKRELASFKAEQEYEREQNEIIATLEVSALRYEEVIETVKSVGFDVSDPETAHKTVLSLITGSRF